MTALFHDLPGPVRLPKPRLEKLAAHYGDQFAHQHHMVRYLQDFISPPSGRWIFKSNGKSGTSTTLAFLFWAEFGASLTTSLIEADNAHEDSLPHRLTNMNVFRFVHQRSDINWLPGYLGEATYLTTVRHPVTRLVSAFNYLCRSHDLSISQFAGDRVRLSALTGFDWTTHAGTTEGFTRFLDYIDYSLANNTSLMVESHWAPQFNTIRPDILAPTLIGKCEDFDSFFRQLADRFDLPRDIAATFAEKPRNVGTYQGRDATQDYVAAPDTRNRIRDLYAKDFEAFGYDL